MIGRAKLLIAISAERVTAAHWNGRCIARHFSVANSDHGLAACREALAGNRELPVYVLVDAVEEDYRLDVLPHARGVDRRELVSRKLRQHYRNTPYCAAEWQARVSGGRRDDRYQFVALTNPELPAPWLALVKELSLPLAGVYLLPVAGAGLVRRLALAAAHVLLVARTSGGLRLSYFRSGHFRLSRLARTDEAGAHGRARVYAEEIANTRLYLHALQAAALDEPLAVVLLDPRDADEEAHRLLATESPTVECRRLGSRDIARLVGRCPESDTDGAALVFLHLLGLRPPGYNLAPQTLLAGYRTVRRRTLLHRACAATVAVTAAACAHAAWELHRIDQGVADAQARRARYASEYEVVTRSFPAAPASAAALQQAVSVAQRLKSQARTPESAMHLVSHALADAPDIVMNELEWKVGRAVAVDGMPAAAAPAASEETLWVSGEVRPFTGDYRAAVGAIRRFADALGRDPGVRDVRLVRLPLDADPGAALAGNTREAGEPAGAAEFRLQVTLRART